MNKVNVIVTGAAGFAGYSLTMHLIMCGYKVYAIVRPGSSHNERLKPENILETIKRSKYHKAANLDTKFVENHLCVIELDCGDYDRIPELVDSKCEYFYHLSWFGGRDDFYVQSKNIKYAVMAVEAAAKIGCKRFFGTGSQAEYGVKNGIITEDLLPEPINAYGDAKVSALYLTKCRTRQLGLDWIWGRIFSLYGLYEPSGRMLPDLVSKLKNGEKVYLSDCTQYWDYLDAEDAAEEIIAIGEKGKNGEVYNIANGHYKPLRVFVEEICADLNCSIDLVEFGKKSNPFISLKPSMNKIYNDTGYNTEHLEKRVNLNKW